MFTFPSNEQVAAVDKRLIVADSRQHVPARSMTPHPGVVPPQPGRRRRTVLMWLSFFVTTSVS